MGYERGRPRLWRLEAFTTKSRADWETFLCALAGAPPAPYRSEQARSNEMFFWCVQGMGFHSLLPYTDLVTFPGRHSRSAATPPASPA